MKLQLGIALGLLAGCATQPPGESNRQLAPGASDVAGGVDAIGAIGAATVAQPAAAAAANPNLQRLLRGNPLCLGVEFLPPAAAEGPTAVALAAVRAEAVPGAPLPAPRPPEHLPYGGRDRAERHTWTMSGEDLALERDPIARETLHFLDDLMGEDRRRLRREIGTPILTIQSRDLQSPGIDLQSEEVQADEEAQWMAEHGVDLLRRPAQQLLRRTPMVRELELELDEFKEDNVPLSEEYGRAHANALGRMSMRIHAGSATDPLELVYIRSGLRIGSSQTQLKLGLSRRLTRDLTLEVKARQDYSEHNWRVRADLTWDLSPQTSLHFVAGDNLDFLATSTVYSLFESPMDGSPGLLVYAVHLF